MVKQITMSEVFKNPRYRGKHIVLVGGKVFTAKTGEGAAKILRRARENHPDETPEIAYLPKSQTLLLSQMGLK